MSEKTLNEQTNKMLQDFISSLPDQAKRTVSAAFEKLMKSDAGDKATLEGDIAPNFDLPNVRGGRTQLVNLLKEGPVVLSFYRGGWCPFCNLEFKALTDALPQIQIMGAALVGVSPETADTSLTTIEKHNLPFEVLSDVGNKIAQQYGLVMTVYDELRPLYEQWGIDLPAANGDNSYQLPLPATYIIKQDGTVHASYVNKDYTSRMEPNDILAALESLQKH